ncbi:D-alanyl-D-alanine carboxypeptidase [Microbacterium sp. 2FI]|uniref:D-alanyl-D-alanine carboxypeptidase family protein n=1 Tax=Microbacterium sp. 2FI TaxID=2502193 RepID=UPI0010FA0D7E|nr:D-alanyl-D-alanine carboxypeptidase [Microbacterium sp. 2FI]
MTTQQQTPDELAHLAELMSREEAPPTGRAPVDPATRRRRRWGWIIAAIVLAVMLAVPGGYIGWALNAPLAPPVVSSRTVTAPTPPPAAITLPTEGAAAISVSGAEEYLGTEASGIWVTSGGDEPRSIASISKLVTALVVLDAHPLASADDPGPTITFDKADHDLYDKYYVMGATIAAMPTGSSMSLHDALATMLIPSASNYAEAVSTWAFGSQWAFANATRTWLAEHGLTGTAIVEPTGISPRNTSTPTDLMAIARLAAANPAIADIVATPSLMLAGPGRINNTNELLGSHGITGLKTGNLGPGTYSLLFTSSLDVGLDAPLGVTGVVLDAASRAAVDEHVVAMLDGIRDGFRAVPVAAGGEPVGSFSTPWGAKAQMVISRDTSILAWSDTPITVSMETTIPKEYRDGEVVGSITWTAGPQTVTADIVVKGTIEPPTDWWRLTHPAELGG